MTTRTQPWHGVLVATALPLRETEPGSLTVDFDGYAEHIAWLAAQIASTAPTVSPPFPP